MMFYAIKDFQLFKAITNLTY